MTVLSHFSTSTQTSATALTRKKKERRTPEILSSGGAAKSPTKNTNMKVRRVITHATHHRISLFVLEKLAAFQKATIRCCVRVPLCSLRCYGGQVGVLSGSPNSSLRRLDARLCEVLASALATHLSSASAVASARWRALPAARLCQRTTATGIPPCSAAASQAQAAV